MTNGIHDHGKEEHQNRDAIDTVHHPEVYAGGVIGVGLAENTQEIRKHGTYSKVIDNPVHTERTLLFYANSPVNKTGVIGESSLETATDVIYYR